MQKKKPTRKQEAKQFAEMLKQANDQTKAAEFWGQLYIGVIKACWEKFTGETLPLGLVPFVMKVCEDAIRNHGQDGLKFEGLVAAAYASFMNARLDKMDGKAPVEPVTVTDNVIVTPAQAREEALAGEPLVVLK